MADNLLSKLGVGGINASPSVKRRDQALQAEAMREAELVRRRQMQQAMMQSQMAPQAPQQMGQPTIQQYVQNMRAADPKAPVAYAAPQDSWLGSVPGLGNMLQWLGAGQVQPNQQLDSRLRGMVGGMGMNNQRHRQILDDFSQERARSGMSVKSL